jgi:hypothetical protein
MIAMPLVCLTRRNGGATGWAGFDESNYRRGVDGGETITKKPAAVPQQLELTRSLASVSNIYSHDVADLWLAFAIDAKRTVKSAVAREQPNLAGRFHAERAIAVELETQAAPSGSLVTANASIGPMNRSSPRDFQNSRVVVRKDLTQTIALTDGRKDSGERTAKVEAKWRNRH